MILQEHMTNIANCALHFKNLALLLVATNYYYAQNDKTTENKEDEGSVLYRFG